MSKEIKKPDKETLRNIAEVVAVGVKAAIDVYLKKSQTKQEEK